jgi:acylphosphatase
VSAGRLDATVTGRVQGVGFRYFVVRAAQALALTGYVRNERDGSVTVVAEGDADALIALERHLRAGPPGAVVAGVHARRGPASGAFDAFDLERPR